MVGASGGELGSGIVVSTRQSLCELTSQAFSLHLTPFNACAMFHYCTFCWQYQILISTSRKRLSVRYRISFLFAKLYDVDVQCAETRQLRMNAKRPVSTLVASVNV